MANRKKGLGQGINALFQNNQMEEFNASVNEKGELVLNLDTGLIVPNSDQPRKNFDEEKIIKLADSIEEHGLLQPIVVKKNHSKFEIIAGERRFRAVKHLGQKRIRAIVVDADENTVFQLALLENLQREDLNPMEEAEAYNVLLTDQNMTQAEVAKIAGKSRAQIGNMVRLLSLNKEEKAALSEGTLSIGHAKVLLSIKDSSLRKSIFNQSLHGGITVRQAEVLAQGRSEKAAPAKVGGKDRETISVERKLTDALGTKVSIQGNEKKGRISVFYSTSEELERLLDLLFHVEHK